MTPQEKEMIGGLIDRVQQTRLQEKDPDAENLLQQGLGRNPDALYILAQTVLVQKYALAQAQKQLSDLKSQVDQSRQQEQPHRASSFLGSLLGHNDPPAPPPPPPYAQQGPGSAPQYAPVPGYAPPSAYGSSPSQFGGSAPQGGGFLRSALQTATGVAAGALAFQGIESLMHGFGGSGGGFGGGQGFGSFGGGAPREEIVNNYYGDSGSDRGGLSSDIEDRRGDAFGDNFDDRRQGDSASSDDTANDFAGEDDLSTSSDADSDAGSFDSGDSSSFDSGDSGGGGDDSSFS